MLDFAGPFEVVTTASRVHRKRVGATASVPFEVRTVARDTSAIRARAGLRILPDASLASPARVDVLIVPGGVVDTVSHCAQTLQWLQAVAPRAEVLASVCTGAFVLAAAGLLRDGEATTHWEDLADLAALHPTLHVRGDRLWIDRGTIVTSAGIAAGIAMSLHLVARLCSPALALATARQMEVPWTDDPRVPPAVPIASDHARVP